jgi:hypothetical protein
MNIFLFIGIFIVMFTTQNILDIGCEPSQDLLDHDLREAHDKEMQAYEKSFGTYEKSFGTSDNVVLQESDKESVLQIQSDSDNVVLQESDKESVLQIQSDSDNVVLSESDKESVLQIQSAIAASYEKNGIAELKLFNVALKYSSGICYILEENGISLDEKDEGVIFERVVKVYKSYLDNDKSGKSKSELIDDLYYEKTEITFDNLINREIYNRTH